MSTTSGDVARASARVEVSLEEAFRIFTEEIDQWWRRGRQLHSGWADIRADHPARHRLEAARFLAMTGRLWGDLLSSLRRHAA